MTTDMAIDMDKFVREKFGDVDTYAAAKDVSAETKRKWRQRGVPISELASALLILEADTGTPVSLLPYKEEGYSCSKMKRDFSGASANPFD